LMVTNFFCSSKFFDVARVTLSSRAVRRPVEE
jgi:hypothetical protein